MVVPGLEGWTDKVDADRARPAPSRRARDMTERRRRLPRADAVARRRATRCSTPSTCRPPPTATSSGRRCAGRAPSASWTASSSGCRRCGTRRSSSRSPRACHVYGAASMGALRAAELDAFGMRGRRRGVPRVRRGRARGRRRGRGRARRRRARVPRALRRDGRRPGDARRRACARGSRHAREHGRLARRGVKATFYAERALVAALDRDDEEHERLRAWLPGGRVERKREDALALLRVDPARARRGPRAVPAALDAAADPLLGGGAPFGRARGGAASPGRRPTRRSRRCSTRRASMRRGTAGSPTARCSPRWHGMPPPRPGSTSRRGRTRPRWSEERRARGLLEPEDVDTWLDERGLDRDDLPDVARAPGGAAVGARRASRRSRRRGGAHGPVRRRVCRARRPRGAQARGARIAPVRSRDPRRRRGRRVVLPRAAGT